MAGMLKIIAERAGLSQSTVSQILNRKANDFSSEETRQRVFALASELGYKQNFGHKLLRETRHGPSESCSECTGSPWKNTFRQ